MQVQQTVSQVMRLYYLAARRCPTNTDSFHSET